MQLLCEIKANTKPFQRRSEFLRPGLFKQNLRKCKQKRKLFLILISF